MEKSITDRDRLVLRCIFAAVGPDQGGRTCWTWKWRRFPMIPCTRNCCFSTIKAVDKNCERWTELLSHSRSIRNENTGYLYYTISCAAPPSASVSC